MSELVTKKELEEAVEFVFKSLAPRLRRYDEALKKLKIFPYDEEEPEKKTIVEKKEIPEEKPVERREPTAGIQQQVLQALKIMEEAHYNEIGNQIGDTSPHHRNTATALARLRKKGLVEKAEKKGFWRIIR